MTDGVFPSSKEYRHAETRSTFPFSWCARWSAVEARRRSCSGARSTLGLPHGTLAARRPGYGGGESWEAGGHPGTGGARGRRRPKPCTKPKPVSSRTCRAGSLQPVPSLRRAGGLRGTTVSGDHHGSAGKSAIFGNHRLRPQQGARPRSSTAPSCDLPVTKPPGTSLLSGDPISIFHEDRRGRESSLSGSRVGDRPRGRPTSPLVIQVGKVAAPGHDLRTSPGVHGHGP